ncbi:alpha/beta fold hydrolase [Streptomyces sp. NBC_01235]|uniref:alpha/beta fold hydrolase n=1 Tax=Streptomyces sp. NBC_01235 TaxID=2903788 RepID=UPI002E15C91E|nr:alpha/beta hydrolase [Streptomyces sp. NBC_01235]
MPSPSPYARTVRGSGPGLLLAHGAGGSVEANYGPVMDALAAGHTVVGVDYPGTGGTPRSARPLEVDTLVAELVAAADAEGLERFAVCGYSLGGAVAIRLAARHPERVTALALTAPFPHADAELRLNAQVWHALCTAGETDTLGRFMLAHALSPVVLDAMTPQELKIAAKLAGRTAPEGTAEHVDLVVRADVRADLARITAPTLVISPVDDRLVPPRLHRATAAGIKGARLAETPGGHLPFTEHPARWAALLAEALLEPAPEPVPGSVSGTVR